MEWAVEWVVAVNMRLKLERIKPQRQPKISRIASILVVAIKERIDGEEKSRSTADFRIQPVFLP